MAATVPVPSVPLPDIEAEARRLMAAASARTLPVRLLGGLAVRLRGPGGREHPFARSYKDIDLVVRRRACDEVAALVTELGWVPDQTFNAMNGHRRLLFREPSTDRQVDVFVGSFAMCHTIPLLERLDCDPISIPLAELLLTKLQIIELNEKDQVDVLALLTDHDVAEEDGETINAARVAELCSRDWGLWRTAKLNIGRTREAIARLPVTQSAPIATRLEMLWERIQSEPKPARWRMRDRVGDRVRWYDEPEEVD